mgnify:FL=1
MFGSDCGEDAAATLAHARRVVIKVGSSSLARPDGHLSVAKLHTLVEALVAYAKEGHQVVLVSSGAQAAAMGPLGLKTKPRTLAGAQAAASVGQGLLIAEYTRAFGTFGLQVGQVLLTAEDVLRRNHYKNARRALEELIALGVVPVINENDTVATDELRFGENDKLAALVAHLVGADALVLLSDVDALYTGPPEVEESRRVPVISRFSELEAFDIGGSGSSVGTGGMATKVAAAAMATTSGIPVMLTSAANAQAALGGQDVGTWFRATGKRLAPRQLWLAYAANIQGQIVVDAGAAQAITTRNASLLPAGVVGTNGDFDAGDVVEVVDEDGLVLARGRSGFSAQRLEQVKGMSMADIESATGKFYAHEAVHRDELVVMARHRRI